MSSRTIKTKAKSMGRFSVEIEVSNAQEVAAADLGKFPADKIRRMRLSGVVDTGATRLVLPEKVASQLGLPKIEKINVRYADGRRAKREAVGFAQVEIQGRRAVFTAVVGPGRRDALIGAIVLEELDFVADRISQSLVPRDPKGVFAEIE